MFSKNEEDTKRFVKDTIINEMKINLDVFCTGMENGVGREIGNANVITMDERSMGKRNMKVTVEALKPDNFGSGISNSSEFSFGG